MSNAIYITHHALPGYLLWLQKEKGITNAIDLTPVQHRLLLQEFYRHVDDMEIDSDNNEYREKFDRA